MPEFWIISILMLLLPLLWVGLNKRVLGLVDFFSFLHEKNRVGWIFFSFTITVVCRIVRRLLILVHKWP